MKDLRKRRVRTLENKYDKHWKRFVMNEQIKSDPTHPNHYIQSGLSVWDVIKAYTEDLTGVDAFNAGNAIKYILRWHHKNGIEDLKKAKVYIDELIKSFEEKESENSGE